ncbi:hypothetical protein G6F31_016384 [Rhizopus arrhizus]|nr:hypothetical protein G6F31_016384 [Rhizopus arrhizus]
MEGVSEEIAREAFRLAAAKLPISTTELRSKDAAELGKELESLLKAQFGLRMQKATQQLANTSQLRNVRRDIARVRTLLTEKAVK